MPKPAIEATLEFEWPSELDQRPARVDESRFSTEMAMARFGARPRVQFDPSQLDETASSQPFFVGAPFGEGSLIGFRFVDFGPYGQEFARSSFQEEAFDGFVPLAETFAGFARAGRFGAFASANGANSASAANSAANGASGGGSGVDTNSGAYNPFFYQHLARGGSYGSGGDGDGSSSSESGSSGGEPILPIGFFGILPWGPLGMPIGFSPRPGFGPGAAGLFPFIPPLYACWDPCGPGVPTPILGWPFGIFNPIIGPIGPFGFPFPHLPHHHCPPPCVPEPSHLAMLLTLVPGLGLMYRSRRRKAGK